MNNNEVRLIDANALKEDLRQYFSDGVLDGISARLAFNQIIHDIDNAPTADDWEQYSTKLWKEAYEQGKADRPQGEWIKSDWFCEIADYKLHCPICHEDILSSHTSFCPNCGAKMKGGETNDE